MLKSSVIDSETFKKGIENGLQCNVLKPMLFYSVMYNYVQHGRLFSCYKTDNKINYHIKASIVSYAKKVNKLISHVSFLIDSLIEYLHVIPLNYGALRNFIYLNIVSR